ncbi:peptidoglycan recognition protein 5 [Anguilla anguilla]|uniref:peptidoglycan recognition protein 5 n=1 Tax=Anguilla anguilla TaxID=7936 RepID=UPI0015AA014E|nr:peptidoglycan recognition protein 5 [Anguilla anguilla]
MDRSIHTSDVSEQSGVADGNNTELTQGVCLRLVSRSQWGALAPVSQERLKGPAQKAIIHHTALWPCRSHQDCLAQLRYTQKLHMQDRDFHDIGYNFLVGVDGTVYEGRGWGIVGAHAKGNNYDSLGIAFMGNFNDETPSLAALSSTKQLLQRGVNLGYLQPAFTLLGHRDVAKTECPGNTLYEALWLLALH